MVCSKSCMMHPASYHFLCLREVYFLKPLTGAFFIRDFWYSSMVDILADELLTPGRRG